MQTVAHHSRVLVAVESEETRQAARSVLERDGFVVDEAADLDDALRRVAQLHPDLVVVGMRRGDLRGLDLLARLRLESSLPLIAVTGAADTSRRTVALRIADDCLDEPVMAVELAPRARAVLGRRRDCEGARAPAPRKDRKRSPTSSPY